MIIGITGLIGSGKNAASDYLVSQHGFTRLSFASTLKDAVAAIFDWDREMLEGLTEEARHQRDQIDTWWANRLNIPHLTPRWVLQKFGTEVCRRSFHEDIWVASVENQLRKKAQNVVISDCRFPNELIIIKKLGGVTVRVERGERPIWYEDAVQFNNPETHSFFKGNAKIRLDNQNVHASEYSSVGLNYDYYIDNNGTLDDLHKQVASIVNL